MKLILFTSHPPHAVTRLISQLEQAVPEARIGAILYQTPVRDRVLPQLHSWPVRILRDCVRAVGTALLRFIHACPALPNGRPNHRLKDLKEFCQQRDCTLMVTRDLRSAQAMQFAVDQAPDLGIIYGPRSDAPPLFALPRAGSIVLDRGSVRDCGEAAPAGLAEMSSGRAQIRLSVRRLGLPTDGPAIESGALSIDPYDTLFSVELKTRVLGNDLLIQAVSDLANGSARELPGTTPEDQISPAPPLLQSIEEREKFTHLFFRSMRCWPDWKLLLKCTLFLPKVAARNWSRRLRGRSPVIILYHHLVSDHPHYLGIPTEVFYRQVSFFQRHYHLATLEEATTALRSGKNRIPMIVLTFDDGYRENFVNLRAVTEQTGAPVSLFISTDYIGSNTPFGHDQKRLEFDFLPLEWEQVAQMQRSGFEIGSHTRTHFDCGSSDPVVLKREIIGSKEEIEQRLGQPVKFFSFPWGQPRNMSPAAVEIARAAYPFVCSACGGENFPATNGSMWHLLRRNHFNDLWECELEIQAILQG